MNAASNSASAQTRPDTHEGARHERTGSANVGPGRAHDASMEEILASIRKIIADEQAIPAAEREPSEVAFARVRGARMDGGERSSRGPAMPAAETDTTVAEADMTAAENDDSDFEGWLAATASSARLNTGVYDADEIEHGADQRDEEAPAPETVAADSLNMPMENEGPGADFAASANMPHASADWRADERDSETLTGPAADPASSPIDGFHAQGFHAQGFDANAVGGERAPPQLSVVDTSPEAHASAPAPTAASAPLPGERPLLSADASSSVNSSFQALAQSVMLRNSAVMEQAVRDMLRPMLKQWLDDNLPPIVERLVRAEIERAARGGP